MTLSQILLATTTQPSDWLLFFGRFHPLLVHLPIGFLLIVIALEILRMSGKVSFEQSTIKFILLITAISATFACLAGYFLSLEGGYNPEILEEHKWQGIWLAIFSWIAYLTKLNWIMDNISISSAFYYPSIILANLMMFVAGHHGGNLTHGETYLTENTPQPFRDWFGIAPKEEKISDNELPKITNINEAIVFKDIIKPIFKNKCEQCHNASKMKGDLRMDTIELLKKGGEHGAIFVAGKSDDSELMKRMLLPESNDDHMPPKGKNQPTEQEISLIRWWIDNGAPFDKKVAELTQTEEIKPILSLLGGGVTTTIGSINQVKQDKFEIEEKIFSQNVAAANQSVIDELKKNGALILPFAQNNNYVEISFVNNRNFSDKESAVLSKLPEQTLWLRLSDTQITDKAIDEIVKLKNLTRIHLENTKITDNGLLKLANLKNLEYLNLIGTQITDSGLKQLSKCQSLKKIYLWQSKATQTGVDELRKILVNTTIDLGISQKEVEQFLNAKADTVSDDVYKKK